MSVVVTCATSGAMLMRLRPPALCQPGGSNCANRAYGSAERCSCGFDLRPSVNRADRTAPTGPPDLRLAAHAASTSGPLSTGRIELRQPGGSNCANRASGSAPGPALHLAYDGCPASGPPDLRLASSCSQPGVAHPVD